MSTKLTTQDAADCEFEGELQPGTTLFHGQYVIEEFLSNGGFGITYLAKDSLHRLVVIKECFPEVLCARQNATVRVRSRGQVDTFRAIIDLFIAEARNLARLSHPNIVGVHQVFEDNGTAYMAMDFIEGRDLLEVAESATSFEPARFERIVGKMLDAIEFIHNEGILHRDISPDNILLSTDDEPVLIDFGAAQETVADASGSLGDMRTVKDGYSPQEFYVADAEHFPSSDLYCFAASLYHVMTKEIPIGAQARLSAIAGGDEDPYVSIKGRVNGYSEPFLDAIDRALNLFPKNRIQSAAEWRALITQSKVARMSRGVVSRLFLAVSDGKPVEEYEENEHSSDVRGSTASERPATLGELRRTSSKRSTDAFVDNYDAKVGLRPSKKGPSKRLYMSVAVAAVLVLGGGAALVLTGSDADRAAIVPETPVPSEQVATVVATDVVVTSEVPVAGDGQGPDFMAELRRREQEAASGTKTLPTEVSPSSSDQPISSVDASAQPETSANEGGVQDASSVVTGKALQFSVVADASDPTIIASAEGPLAKHLKPGFRLLSVNGFPIASMEDVGRIVDVASGHSAREEVQIALGIEDPSTGTSFVRNVDLPVLHQTMLLNGVSFETVRDGDAWATFVVTGSGQDQSDLQSGDRVVALMPANELIDKEDALPSIIQRELKSGATQFNFAVERAGEMWLVTMSYSTASGS